MSHSMTMHKRILLFGSILLLAALLFTFAPTGSSRAFAASLNGCPPTLSENANNSWVTVLQYTLNGYAANGKFSFDFYPLSVDGQFGPATLDAVSAFQQDYSFLFQSINGVVGSSTWAALGYCQGNFEILHGFYPNSRTHCPPTLSYGSGGILVQALQEMLNLDKTRSLYSNTYPDPFTVYLANDGSFGTQTQHAVMDYQYAATQKGSPLSVDGEVGQHTWSVLGMCW